MNIEKAIELLSSQEIRLKTQSDHDHYEAILLGIQALIEVQQARNGNPALNGELLPGETE